MSAELPQRPVLKPALRRLWRDTTTMQLGVEPRHATVLAGMTPAEADVLALLDGTRDADAVVAAATELGVEATATGRLLRLLAGAGALDDAAADLPPMSERRRQRLRPDALSLSLMHREPGAAARLLTARACAVVEMHGAGRVGATAASLLAAAGVGTIAVVDDGAMRDADVAPGGVPAVDGDTRGDALVAHLRRTAPEVSTAAGVHGRPTLAVVAPAGSVVSPETVTAVRLQPHLFVAVRETTAVVGPFVVPGRTPCLRCVQLSRGDRDPRWPALAAQLVGSRREIEPCDVALATCAASITAMHALRWIDGGDDVPTLSGVVELDLSDGRLRRRSVAAHPACGCGASDDQAIAEPLDRSESA